MAKEKKEKIVPWIKKIDENHRMLKYLVIHANTVNRCMLAMFSDSSELLVNEHFKAIENAVKLMSDISDIFEEKE